MNKIRDLRTQLKLSQATLAELAGTTQPQIKRLEKGDRKFTMEWAERLAGPLHTTPEALMFGDEGHSGMEVMGVIEAGKFRDITLEDQTTTRQRITVARDNRFPHARQYALEVAGDSMDELFPDGSFVTCVNFAESGLNMKPGLIVHVERTMSGTHLVEATLKQVMRENGGFLLIPRSKNPRHLPMRVNGDSNTEFEIKGVVTGKWEPVSF